MKSGPNTSAAVMQQRHEAHDSLDDFPTPPWATRAVLQIIKALVLSSGPPDGLAARSVCDPCANRGHMARALAESFGRVHTSDVHDYSLYPRRAAWRGGYGPGAAVDGSAGNWFCQDRVADFLFPDFETDCMKTQGVDWFSLNPPFKLALEFILKALEIAQEGVAVFVRSAFLEGQDRYRDLFRDNPPTVVAQFVERVVLHKGLLRDPAQEYWDPTLNSGEGDWKRPSTATAYCWLLWIKDAEPRPFQFIPPCRLQLERPGDYPVNPDERRAMGGGEGSLL